MASQSCELRSDCLVVHFLLASNSRISYKARFRYSALCSSILSQCRQHLQPCTSHHIHPPRRAFFYMPYTSHSTWSITTIPVLGLCSGNSLSMLVWHIPSHNNHTHSLPASVVCARIIKVHAISCYHCGGSLSVPWIGHVSILACVLRLLFGCFHGDFKSAQTCGFTGIAPRLTQPPFGMKN